MKQFAALTLLIVSLFLSACSLFSSSPQVKHYYQIYYRPKDAVKPPIAATVRIKSFDVDKIYKRYKFDKILHLWYYLYINLMAHYSSQIIVMKMGLKIH